MSFIAWFYRQLKKLDKSLDEFYSQVDVEYFPDGTIKYHNKDKYVTSNEPEDDVDALK